MGTKKKASELIFNLQWRHKLDNGGDKSNVIGMYDTPTTTSNFEMFKSYLLKNSGVADNDVKVTYLTDNGQEWVIDSQEWFEIALSAFRLKARLGEIIFLKLDKISSQMGRKHSNDVETQFDNSINSNADVPPEWFINYMKQFKRDVVEEVTFAVSSNIANCKEKEVPVGVASVPKKNKPECSKRGRKHMILGETPIDKELLKTLKYDRKLEMKLDKLDAKTKKIKEKKQALISKLDNEEHRQPKNPFLFIDSEGFAHLEIDEEAKDEGRQAKGPVGKVRSVKQDDTANKHPQIALDVDGVPLMNACLAPGADTATLQQMVGGEVYLHKWEVMNNGKLPWTSKTELRLTWGSAEMKPHVNVIRCPPLKPREKGTISVRFEIPKKSGKYESYWNFYDEDVRFGRALNCCVVVQLPLTYITDSATCKKIKMEAVQNVSDLFKESKFLNKTVPVIQGPNKVLYFPYGVDLAGNRIRTCTSRTASTPEKPNEQPVFPNVAPPKEVPTTKSEVIEEKLPRSHVENIKHSSSFDHFSEGLEKSATVQNTQTDLDKDSATAVIDLSRRFEDIKIEGMPNLDSDSDWESLWSYGKPRIFEENRTMEVQMQKTNVYGINEKDLIVDLSKSSKDIEMEEDKADKEDDDKKDDDIQKRDADLNEDNNNNATSVNNNSSGESISEIASEASSDLSSGYDVLNAPDCDDKDENSGYVYITIDGNKMPVPKYILRPDFLAHAEEAPGPLVPEDEDKRIETSTPKPNIQEELSAKLEAEVADLEQNLQEAKSFMSHCSAAGTCFSEVNSNGRLFIFPQNNPGFEVVSSGEQYESGEKVYSPTNKVEPVQADPSQSYTWSQSDSQYTIADFHNTCAPHLVSDLYGHLDQTVTPSQTPTNSDQHPTCCRSPERPSCQYQHVPNYQQSGYKPKPCNLPPCKDDKTPSAPPQQPAQSPNHPHIQNVPVHILPENLVNGAVHVASSAISTARSVINMIVPPKAEPGKWVNGHWVTENPESTRAKNLCILADMGFWNVDLNATLLARYNDDVARVVSELVQ
jgi:hypothetical protein